MISIKSEVPEEGPAIEHLLDIAFGPDRKSRPSYKVREGVAPQSSLCFAAHHGPSLAGVIRFTPVHVGDDSRAVLLGPIAVHPDHENLGIGSQLMKTGIAATKAVDLQLIIAIGEPGYLTRFGFEPASPHGLSFPVLVEDQRFLVLPLTDGAAQRASGMVSARHP
ncbi:MAG: N-acetyltransferase [Alphaproteobacteria bacterium]|jgi:predicted N-acetyltransferase YhbS|nr:N-acetyltransferase [Alphaproteobacteria bacterium]